MKINIFNCIFIGLLTMVISYSNNAADLTTNHIMAKDTLKKIQLNQKMASGFARLALKCIQREYPNKLDHVMNNASEVEAPSVLHPAFYGCLDWHSSVHGHWMLVRLLKLFPNLPEAAEIRKALNNNLTKKNIDAEVAYLHQENRKSFERTYGWAWLLKLSEELYDWNNEDGRLWFKNLEPLTQAIVNRYLDFLKRQTYPIRTGVHPNTAFGIAFALDYARKAKNKELETLLTERCLTYYSKDKNCPAEWEPGGEDFFSPCLVEADLMRRVMNPAQFREWFYHFIPGLSKNQAKNLLKPAIVSDRSDPKIVHLDGLNLSRAWCMNGIAAGLPVDDPVKAILLTAAHKHAEDALAHISSGQYEGEHWLASFAVYFLSTQDSL